MHSQPKKAHLKTIKKKQKKGQITFLLAFD